LLITTNARNAFNFLNETKMDEKKGRSVAGAALSVENER